MARFAWLGVLGVAAVLGACGKSEGGAQPISKEELPARVAKLVCEGMASCCQNSGHSFDVATCKVAYEADVEIDELDSPNIDYDAQAAGECLDRLGALGVCGDVDEDDAPVCRRVFRGKLALGAACANSEECREAAGQSVSCYSEDGLSPAVCTLRGSSTSMPRGKLGDACGGTCSEGSDCLGFVSAPAPGPGAPAPSNPALCYRDDGLWCDYTSGTCKSLLALGNTCTDFDSCGGGSFCDFYSGTCRAAGADGEGCDGDDWCQSDNCVYPTDPPAGVTGPSGVCQPRGTVTAEQCEIDIDIDIDEGDSEPPQPAP